jgi:hypothetical protein
MVKREAADGRRETLEGRLEIKWLTYYTVIAPGFTSFVSFLTPDVSRLTCYVLHFPPASHQTTKAVPARKQLLHLTNSYNYFVRNSLILSLCTIASLKV